MIKKFLTSLKYAVNGIKIAIKDERNFRIDLIAMMVVLRLSFFYEFTKAEWAIVVLISFLIPSLELMNTGVERSVFLPDNEHYNSAGQAKDTAAAAVLFLSIAAVIIAFILFLDFNVIANIFIYYKENFIESILSSAFLIVSYFFINKDEIFKGKE